MRRVEVTTKLSPAIFQALHALLDLDISTIEAAWMACSEKGRGYFVHRIRQAPSGKIREIHTPQPSVYLVQQQILKRVLYALPISPHCYGGVPRRSHISAARVHLSQAGDVLQTDIIDAFGQSTYAHLARVLRKALKPLIWSLQLNHDERHIIVGWLTHMMVINPGGGRYPRLPLGTPTSTAAFNLLWTPIDAEIVKVCHQLSPNQPIRYTRYVDDLVFSSDTSISDELLPRITFIIKEQGYRLNQTKTLQGPRETAIVHGLCWRNERVDLPETSVIRLAKRLHRLNTLISNAPSEEDWSLAAQLIQELDFLVNTLYPDGMCPQGLIVSPLLRERVRLHQTPPARWADELWG